MIGLLLFLDSGGITAAAPCHGDTTVSVATLFIYKVISRTPWSSFVPTPARLREMASSLMSLYGTVNRMYRILPGPARRWADERAPQPVRSLRRRIVSRLAQRAQPDELYNGRYYDEVVDPIMLESAEAIAESIARELGAERGDRRRLRERCADARPRAA